MPCPCRKLESSCDPCRAYGRAYYRKQMEASPVDELTKRNKWRTENNERYRESRRDSNRRLRQTLIDAYGGKCVCCGIDYAPYLELDHVNNDGNKHRAIHGDVRSMWRDLRDKGFPPTVQVLCANCHNAKTRSVPCLPHVPEASESLANDSSHTDL